MNLLLFLLRSSWRTVLAAAAVGGVSGVASMALVGITLYTLRDPGGSRGSLVAAFVGLCAIVLATRIGSQLLLARLTQQTVSRLRLGLCRRVLASPLRHVEEISAHRILASLTGDVSIVAAAMNGLPVLGVNIVVLICGGVYLATLSVTLALVSLAFAAVAMASYWYSASFAKRYIHRSRVSHDLLMKRIRELIEGAKELKMHRDRRLEFVDDVLEAAEHDARWNQYLGDSFNDAAVAWGRLTFFIAIGLLLFFWPRVQPIDSVTLTGYVVTVLYLMSPLEQILGWLPFLAWASCSVKQIDQLGLMLHEGTVESETFQPVERFHSIELSGVAHSYKREGHERGFLLGPIDLTIRPGETLFIVGGNGSGKTTLGKLITGLYIPEAGEIRLDGCPVTDATREGYRQLFSVVFDDAQVFDSLWGLGADDLDQRANDFLRQLEIDHVVKVTNGTFSTTSLSRGQRKRLALVTAYLEDRPIYVFDEWAADQDPVFRKVFYLRLLPELKRQGKAVIAITHDDRYFDTADRVVKLEVGKIVEAFRHETPPLATLDQA